MKSEKGFSLVELLVTIAVIAILSTGVIVMVGMNSGWKVNKAHKILDSTLNKTMVYAMSKGNVVGVVVYELNETYYATMISSSGSGAVNYALTEDKIVDKVELGKAPISLTIRYKANGAATEQSYTLTNQTSESNMTSVAEFLFDRSTGAIKDVKISGMDSHYTGIDVSDGTKTRKIKIYAATGRHEAE